MAFDPTKDFITRKEKYLTVMAGNTDISYPEPITREEHYLAAMCDPDNNTAPDPITRREHYLSAIVQKISEGGGGIGELIKTDEVEVNTTSTTAESVKTITLPDDISSAGKFLYVKIRDKAGVKDGYFFGSDNYGASYLGRLVYKGGSNSSVSIGTSNSYGVHVSTISEQSGNFSSVSISARYSSGGSGTINGTYSVEIYLCDIVL